MNYTNICDNLINYLIDKNIHINENDTTLTKLKLFLLKYKRIISIILLILLLIIGQTCNLTYLNFNISPDNENNKNENNKNKNNKNKIINGGVYEGFKASSKLAASSSQMKDTLKHGKFDALKSGYQGVANRAERAKDFAPWLYGLIYSIAITILIFMIFMPAVAFFILGIICYNLVKGKISYIKGL